MKVIPHNSPCPDPITVEAIEYVFEPRDTEGSLPAEVLASCRTAEGATDELHRRLNTLKYPCALSVARLLRGATVSSVVVNSRTEVYYRARLGSPQSGASILVQFCQPLPDVVGNIELWRFPEYREFLNVFRNVTREIPPYNNIWFGDGESLEYFDICDYDEKYEGHAERMGEWNHAIPLLFNGCGDYYLLSPAGRIGFRDHGAVTVVSESQRVALAKWAREFAKEAFRHGDSDRPLVLPPTRPLMTEVTPEKFIEAVLAQLPRPEVAP
jgi:hypothetical protein